MPGRGLWEPIFDFAPLRSAVGDAAAHTTPDGMVALCRDHHPEADAGAFTIEQLHHMKREREGRDRNNAIGARFNWMRDKLLAVVGGNFHYETPIVLRVQHVPVVWFNRDPSGRPLVNCECSRHPDSRGW